MSRQGHVLTVFHVVENCGEIRARRGHGEVQVARVVATDAQNDLTILKVPSQEGEAAASVRSDSPIRQGESVVALGFPLRGLLSSGVHLTTGIVTALAGLRDDTRYVQISAPLQPGNSGGPLLDQAGNVIGILVGTLDAVRLARYTGAIPQNVNFALKNSLLRAFLDANRVDYVTPGSGGPLPVMDIADRAVHFTVAIECWK